MSEQQLERLQALLANVEKNRRQPRAQQEGALQAAAGQRDNAPPPPRKPAPPSDTRAASRATAPLEKAFDIEENVGIGAPPPLPAPRPSAAAQPPIVPRVIEPEPPRASTRPIAQLVSKHTPPVDATFGAMLKRSLSLRPH